MPTWIIWTTFGALGSLAVIIGLLLSRGFAKHAGEPNGAPSSEDEAGGQAEENPEVHRLTGAPLRILVVEDDPNLRALLRTSFEVAEIEVEEADSAESAAAKI